MTAGDVESIRERAPQVKDVGARKAQATTHVAWLIGRHPPRSRQQILGQVDAHDVVPEASQRYSLGALPAARIEHPQRAPVPEVGGELASDQLLANRVTNVPQFAHPSCSALRERHYLLPGPIVGIVREIGDGVPPSETAAGQAVSALPGRQRLRSCGR